MLIGYIGNFRPRTEKGEEFSTECHLARTLELLGHEVTRLQEPEWTAEMLSHEFDVRQPDLVLWTRTWGLQGDALRMLRRLQCPSVSYHLDLYAPIERGERVAADPWWHTDVVFTADGGSDAYWAERGINHVWAAPGVFEPECYLAEPVDRFRHDVVFCGSYGYHKEWPWRPRLIDWLHDTYGERFGYYGKDAKIDANRCIRGADLNALYASARLVIGDSLCVNFNHANYYSDRIPESLGRGAVLIHPRIPGLERLFRYGEHFEAFEFGDFEGLKRAIDGLLADDDRREKMRRAGHEHAKSRHTYTVRMRGMLDYVKAWKAKDAAGMAAAQIELTGRSDV